MAVISTIKGYKDHYYALNKGIINKLDVDKNSLDKVDIDLSVYH